MNKNELKLKTISYTGYNSLKCPVRYYYTYLFPKREVNEKTIIGTVVHEVYENIINKVISEKNPVIVDIYNDETSNKKIKDLSKNSIETYRDRDWKVPENLQLDEIVKEIQENISIKFIEYIQQKKDNGAKILIEQKVLSEISDFMDVHLNLYSRPDITIIEGNTLNIVDIKTSSYFNPDYKKQLMMYLYVYNKEMDNKFHILRGSIFFTRFNNFKHIVWDVEESINKETIQTIEKLDDLYKKLDINNMYEVKEFTENLLTIKKKELKEISDLIFSYYPEKDLCKFCPVKKYCPLVLHKKTRKFRKEVNENKNVEHLVIFSSSSQSGDERTGFIEPPDETLEE